MNSVRNYVRVHFSKFEALLRGSAPAPPPSLDSAAKSTAASAKSTTAKNVSLIGSTWRNIWSGSYYYTKIFERKSTEPVLHADPLPEPAPMSEPVLPDDAPVLAADLEKSPEDSGDTEVDDNEVDDEDSGDREVDDNEGDDEDSADESDFDDFGL